MGENKVVHCKRDVFDVYVGRPSKFGNPFVINAVNNREQVIELYKKWVVGQVELMKDIKAKLRGKVLGCWCAPLACHGDVLVRIANE